MSNWRNHHYVPEWYQKRFIPEDGRKDRKYYHLDLKPPLQTNNGVFFRKNPLNYWGPERCFCAEDLYTTKYGNWESKDIETKFFAKVDSKISIDCIDAFTNFSHYDTDPELVRGLLHYISLQKLRTPKGLENLANITKQTDRNDVLMHMQYLQNINCAIWTESVWSIVDAENSETKFIISDHPVTIYNQACYPLSKYCRDSNDPDIRYFGSHTIFPLSLNKLLILTNLSWVRNPYSNPLNMRPNPDFFRQTLMDMTQIQVGRKLTEEEVININYIIKQRAYRYIAAGKKEWLYPEQRLKNPKWPSFGSSLLLMPDPRSLSFGSNILMGFNNGRSIAQDEYGHHPNQKGYSERHRKDIEWQTFNAFQGEYARRFGPERRGRSMEFNHLSPEYDEPDFHAHHLDKENKYRKYKK